MIRKGAIIQILPEYQDAGDEEFTWVVVADEEKGRIDVQPVNIPLAIKPVYTFRTDQVRVLSAS